ncbi:MAG: C-GCAxxG-C-C family protein [Desulfomicrobium escambiense]|nr:C-GCAxxG-C-C family protein [Desulfomicrobium escambiense]
MDTLVKKSLALHEAGSNCAQSVLCAFAGEYGFDEVAAHRLATALGAGLGRRQLLCGAVSGGAMAIGAALGNDSGADLEAKERCYAIVAGFVARIESEFGSSDCRTLLGVDLNTSEGKAQVKARGLGASVCDRIIARSTELVAEAIASAKT